MGKTSKYKAKKIVVDGIKFDSIVESEYYLFLKKLFDSGHITSLDLQPKFIIQEKFKHPKEGNIQAITYKADFRVVFESGHEVIVDVKGQATSDAKIKRKMFLKVYPDLDLKWVSKSKKYGENGWIDYFALEKIRRENRKKKVKL